MSNEAKKIEIKVTIPSELAGKRLDQAISSLIPEHSRERLKSWILSGECSVNGKKWRPKDKVSGNEEIEIIASIPIAVAWKSEPIDINIIYQDEDIMVVDKPANLVVHPAAGNEKGTLVNALLHIEPKLENIPRAGIVHRLDKDTTGLMMIAKTLEAHTSLVKQLQERTVTKIYETIVWGIFTAGGTVDQPVGRHNTDRLRMAITNTGKHAITHYRI